MNIKQSNSLQPIVFQKDKGDTRIVVRSWSRRMSVIDLKTFRVMREIDLADHETALFFADKLTSNN